MSLFLKRHSAVILSIALLPCLAFALHAADPVKKASPGVEPLADPQGIHNLFKIGTNVYSGSSPEGQAGFAALEKLGVKTIITVDGAKPDVDLARKHGMRYVHLPHGYDGISTNLQLQLIKAAETLPGPIYVHCHHGKHRGPAAAAVICMAKDGWTPVQAEQWLTAAGTATNYSGLFDVVRRFKKPTDAQLAAVPPEFPESAQVAGLIDAMVAIDDRWDHLKAVRAAGFLPPKEHPDINPANEAVILREHYREAQRLPDARKRGEDFIALLKAAEADAIEAEHLLRVIESQPGDSQIRSQLDKFFDALGKGCASCHKTYRDPAGINSK